MDDVELNDLDQKEQCLFCEEFGKNGEMWFRCVNGGRWAHAECSGRDSPNDYECDFCRKKSFIKKKNEHAFFSTCFTCFCYLAKIETFV